MAKLVREHRDSLNRLRQEMAVSRALNVSLHEALSKLRDEVHRMRRGS